MWQNIPEPSLTTPEPSVCVKLEDDISIKSEQIEDNKGSMVTSTHIQFFVNKYFQVEFFVWMQKQ